MTNSLVPIELLIEDPEENSMLDNRPFLELPTPPEENLSEPKPTQEKEDDPRGVVIIEL